jgi:outer membrane protein assembly factor BamB
MNTPIATPVFAEPHLLVSGFFNGARLLRLHPDSPKADLVWAGKGTSEIGTDTIHALMGSPVIAGDHVYGVCNFGQLRALRLGTGERAWESQELTVEKKRNASAFIVRNGDRYFISNDRGELVVARFTPSGYQEISRTRLIKPTSPGGGRRDLGAVHWSHPAYANRHIVVRNDEEILRASLESR